MDRRREETSGPEPTHDGATVVPAASSAWGTRSTLILASPARRLGLVKYLPIRARVPGHYEHKGEILDVTAAEYSALFPLR